jgi:hypothetical protein
MQAAERDFEGGGREIVALFLLIMRQQASHPDDRLDIGFMTMTRCAE